MKKSAVNQSEMSAINRAAWNTGAYEAWLIESGPPEVVAATIQRDPALTLKRVFKHLGDLNGKRVANPLGSRGKVAVALALLGADVTVFDISESNARYARELALAAGVNLEYIVTDFMALEPSDYRFDLLLMELGILHYFMELGALARQIHAMLKPGSRFVVNDFHPICSKLLTKLEDESSGVRVVADRDYFDTSPHPGQVPYQSFIDIQAPPSLTRFWQLGEIVTAFAQNGFRIETLEETPGWGFPDHVPGLFTLVATRE
jgi:2-polyprenyl-3-methyl-5-hydroxy-6-metoxy-1,4-benzoquinol methylase